MTDAVGSFSDMLRDALDDRLAPAGGFLDMLAEDAVMEFPFAPPGLPGRVEGREAIGAYLAGVGKLLAFEWIGRPAVHAAGDGVVLLEFDGGGRGVATGLPYEQRYVSVIRTAGGRIVHYRDYWNPLAILSALKGLSIEAATVEGIARG